MSEAPVRLCICGAKAVGHDVKGCLLYGPEAERRAKKWYSDHIEAQLALIAAGKTSWEGPAF